MTRLLLPLGLFILLSACASTQPQNTSNVCHMFEEDRSWYRAALRSEERWGIPVHVSMAIIYQESSFRRQARPQRTQLMGFIPWRRPSTAFGYAQALDITWDEYRNEAGGWNARRSSFRDAIDFVGWYSNHSVRRNGIRPDDAYNLYLAYHEGHGGFSRRTYNDKPWLINAARNVQSNADAYRVQYQQCQRELDRNWLMRTFF